MSTVFRIILVVAALIACGYAIGKIRKSQMKIEDAIYWFLLMFLVVLLSIFPKVAFFFSNLLGIDSPANLIFLVMIFLLFVKVFSLSVRNAILQHKFNTLVEEMAIWKKETEEEE